MFGEGTVLEVDDRKGAYVVQFDGMELQRDLLAAGCLKIIHRLLQLRQIVQPLLAALCAEGCDMTILYRSHFVTRNIEEVFLREKIPYTIYSGTQFFQRMEISALIQNSRQHLGHRPLGIVGRKALHQLDKGCGSRARRTVI